MVIYVRLIYYNIDNQLLIAQDYEDLEYMTRKLIDKYELWSLKLDVKKQNIWPQETHQEIYNQKMGRGQ